MAEITKTEARAIFERLCEEHLPNIQLDPSGYEVYKVKRGLRNSDGTGVVAGITRIGNVQGYIIQDNEPVAIPGKLFYRGVDVEELIKGFMDEGRFGFEETTYLLLFGDLPTKARLDGFVKALENYRALPDRFTEDMILAAPSRDIMNKLARSVLALYSYDQDPEDNSYAAQMEKAMYLIARCPVIVAHALAAKQHYYDGKSLYLHNPQPGLSTAENFLYSVRRDNHYTQEEARLLDLCLVLHAEHGGGNNSAFACRVLSSSGTDIYSAISAAVGSLKGPKHGGANRKVMEQFRVIESEVSDWDDEDAVRNCLRRIVRGEIGDGSGLIYGLGHAVYTISDPRTGILKDCARNVAAAKGAEKELRLFEMVERLGPEVLNEYRGENRVFCANVDFYSGLVYQMLDIPEALFTPLFAISRMVGWCAHRIEETCNPGKIIRPAYKAVEKQKPFVPMAERK